MNPQIVTVNLLPDFSTPAVVRISQYDVGRPLLFRVLDGVESAYSISYATEVTIVGTKPSGLGFSVSGTVVNYSVSLNTTEEMTQEAGMIPAEIRFESQNENIGTANFILAVEPSPHPDGTTDGTQETMADLETRLQAEIDDLSDRIDDIEAGGSGLSSTEKQLILTLFSKAAYAESDAGVVYDALEALWATTTRTITYNLSHVSSSNTTASVESGQSYTTTLTASTNYTLNSVTVTMGGVDITSTAYSSGTVSIPSVTGNIVITATAVLAAQSITATYTQSGTVYTTTPLNDLKPDLVVTANYSGGTSETVPASDYTLSGTLEEGTSTITVSYTGLTDTFDVIVSVSALYSLPVIENKAVSGNIQLSSLNGNHIDLTTSANSRSCVIYASGNTGDQQTAGITSPVFFTVPAGASFTAKVKNISYSGNTEANNNFAVAFKKSDKTSIGSTGNIYIPVTGDGTLADVEVSGTLDTTEEVRPPAFMIFVSRGVTLHFDYELYFNGTRYI